MSDILLAAKEVIDTKGYEGVTMAEIAEKADIVEGTVYRYFKNKDDLLLRVAEDWFLEQYGDLVDVSAFSGTYNKLRYLIWHSLRTIQNGPALSRYVMTEVRPRSGYKDTRLFDINRDYTSQIRQVFAEAITSGEFKSGVPERVLRDMVFGTIEHSTWRYLRGEGRLDVEELADEIATVVYRGMTAVPHEDERLDRAIARLEKLAERLEGEN
ncbi:MAG: TetR/AcrR family transcriptional regulator [Novosphingobium sp.]|nr:TetR/AcrR family transcriptional regulator [Novosphingobium sp.]MCP5389867.1 TetR/AcrR family transcriptional regulator [Novosphingobium sp.]